MATAPGASPRGRGHLRRWAILAALLAVAATLLWWATGRLTAESRRLVVRHAGGAAVPAGPITDTVVPPGDTLLRVVAWNVAHGRGDGTGWLAHWTAGSADERRERLLRIAAVLRDLDADVVVLNEVDFDAAWSGGVNQAEALARAAGYPTWVEQRNFDLRLPFARFAFGNAVLVRLPVLAARWLELPARSRLERVVAGAKASATVRVGTADGAVTVVPVHLDFRPGPARRAAVPVLDSLRVREDVPLVLAGDFNAAPPGWSGEAGTTVLGDLLERGWRSPRAQGAPAEGDRTWPTPAPTRALDWILVEPPLEVVEARVVEAGTRLSDHAAVLSVIRVTGAPSSSGAAFRRPPNRSSTTTSAPRERARRTTSPRSSTGSSVRQRALRERGEGRRPRRVRHRPRAVRSTRPRTPGPRGPARRSAAGALRPPPGQ